jgi:hypothetical protein
MIADLLAFLALAASGVPVLLYVQNIPAFDPPPPASGPAPLTVSVLVPARNEENNIRQCVESVLASTDVTLELLVLDDGSTDQTPQILASLAQRDSRLRILTGTPLPSGWSGKQYACHQLSTHAGNDLFVFIDADVKLTPDALCRYAHLAHASPAALLSGFPRQSVVTFSERLLIPLAHFVLLGYLPLKQMRKSVDPAYGAGCGQLFIAKPVPYRAAGGHTGIRDTLHDGLMLPRLLRRAGHHTDLFDATHTSVCRMYQTNGQVWSGLAKNAAQGLGAPRIILISTLLLGAGQVLPWLLLPFASHLSLPGLLAAIAAAVSGLLLRILTASRFDQPRLGALLHPVGVFCLLLIQWWAFFKARTGRPSTWKGRSYPPV